ncbi:hypothetical protein EV421DRAFT_1798962 [Armillaria borealis]|uniref:Uncharacterized protein n=1 Tax=Armillaria borealis TaxID=47425 RepID=A0AA39JL80_9AGAR|nr:hypothetical protein EV421DRAFT_1798962 [Armillaria borealis]
MFSLLLLSLRSQSLSGVTVGTWIIEPFQNPALKTPLRKGMSNHLNSLAPDFFIYGARVWTLSKSDIAAIIELTDAVLNYPSTRPLPPPRLQLYNMSLRKTTG